MGFIQNDILIILHLRMANIQVFTFQVKIWKVTCGISLHVQLDHLCSKANWSVTHYWCAHHSRLEYFKPCTMFMTMTQSQLNPIYFSFNWFAVCPDGRWGVECSDVCDCAHGSCSPISGRCICPAGWEGDRCEKGLDSFVYSTYSAKIMSRLWHLNVLCYMILWPIVTLELHMISVYNLSCLLF